MAEYGVGSCSNFGRPDASLICHERCNQFLEEHRVIEASDVDRAVLLTVEVSVV